MTPAAGSDSDGGIQVQVFALSLLLLPRSAQPQLHCWSGGCSYGLLCYQSSAQFCFRPASPTPSPKLLMLTQARQLQRHKWAVGPAPATSPSPARTILAPCCRMEESWLRVAHRRPLASWPAPNLHSRVRHLESDRPARRCPISSQGNSPPQRQDSGGRGIRLGRSGAAERRAL